MSYFNFLSKIFYDKMDLKLFYFRVTISNLKVTKELPKKSVQFRNLLIRSN